MRLLFLPLTDDFMQVGETRKTDASYSALEAGWSRFAIIIFNDAKKKKSVEKSPRTDGVGTRIFRVD